MKILLTNDDGYESKNIKNLYKHLSKDHEVWIVAPKNNCSGMSAAISYLSEINVHKIDENIFAVEGTPADCTYLGLLSIFNFEFDIVISGINHGANIGNDVLYSGTVGAAIGGRNLKYPPIAISVASYDAKDIDFISMKSIELINKIIKSHQDYSGKVININFPDISKDEYKGIMATGICRRDVPARPFEIKTHSQNDSITTYKYNLSGTPINESFASDAQALKDGYISISILDYSLGSVGFIQDLEILLYE